MPKYTKAEVAAAREQLLKWVPQGTTVYCILRHVSRSGMRRRISFLTFDEGYPRYLDYHVARLLDMSYPDTGQGVVVDGCGMDMGFHVVYNLSSALYRNDDGTYSHEGAYSLKHLWL